MSTDLKAASVAKRKVCRIYSSACTPRRYQFSTVGKCTTFFTEIPRHTFISKALKELIMELINRPLVWRSVFNSLKWVVTSATKTNSHVHLLSFNWAIAFPFPFINIRISSLKSNNLFNISTAEPSDFRVTKAPFNYVSICVSNLEIPCGSGHWNRRIWLIKTVIMLFHLQNLVQPAGTLRLPWLKFFHAFSSVVRQIPG